MAIKTAIKAFRAEFGPSRAMRWCFYASAFLLVAQVALYLWKLLPLAGRADPVAVHYSVLVGIDRLGPWWWTLYSPLLAIGSAAVDWTIAVRLWRHGRREIAIMTGLFTTGLLAVFFGGTLVTVLLNVGV